MKLKIGIALAVLLGVSASIRLPSLYHREIDNDEAITLLVFSGHPKPEWPIEPVSISQTKYLFTDQTTFDEVARDLKAYDVHPPLYFWTAVVWRDIIGSDLFSMRYFSLVCSLIGSLAVFFLSREFAYGLGRGKAEIAAFASTAIYTFSAGNIFFSVEARPYAFLMMLISLMMLAVVRSRNSVGWCFAAGLFAGATVFTNYMGIFSAAFLLVWFSIFELRDPVRSRSWKLKRFSALFVPFLVFVALTVPYFLVQRNSRPTQHAGFKGFMHELKTLAQGSQLLISSRTILVVQLSFLVLVGLALFGVVRARFKRADRERRHVWLCVGVAMFSLLGLTFMNVFLDKSLFRVRYLTPATVGLSFLIGFGLLEVRRKQDRLATVLFMAVLVAEIAFMNHGRENHPSDLAGNQLWRLARMVAESPAKPRLTIIEKGDVRDFAATILHDLPLQDGSDVVVVRPEAQVQPVWLESNYQEVWYLFVEDTDEARKAEFRKLVQAHPGLAMEESAQSIRVHPRS